MGISGDMPLADLYRVFPNLAKSDAKKKSSETANYNCIAWAANETRRRWWPRASGYYWPANIRDDDSLEAFVEAFATLGYEPCTEAHQEPGYEKVAVYAFAGHVKHMARSLDNGKWTSKLGDLEDIEHELDDLTSIFQNGYGETVQILRRLTG